MRRKLLSLAVVLALASPGAGARANTPACGGAVHIERFSDVVQIENGCVARTWAGQGLETSAIWDQRTGARMSLPVEDFTLDIDGVSLPSSQLPVHDVAFAGSGTDHATITWTLQLPGIIEVRRRVHVYAGVAGFDERTTLRALTPLPLSGYRLSNVHVWTGAAATLHSFRAGADWREPGWKPSISVGDPHAGDWREEKGAAKGVAVAGTAQWASARFVDPIDAGQTAGQHVGIVMERRDYASSVASYDGRVLSAGVDFSRDLVYTGPFEEDVHAENPTPAPARHRVLVPGEPLELERSLVVVGTDADDETWQFSKYLTHHRLAPYARAVTFNSDGVDTNAISTGAKDDMNFDRFKAILPAVREMGADTFIFDDGWMSRSGDWCPDSAACPEPRWDGNPSSKFRPRFPDDRFEAVREYLRDDPRTPADDPDLALGLWMTPMAFHPRSKAFQANPQWSCAPVGTATSGLSIIDPNGGSNEPGIGLWNPRALGVDPDDGVTSMRLIDYIEGRILRAIEVYGATYFKFDFLVWVDCGGRTPVTMYEYRDEFMDMLDRVQSAHPEVTLQIDDTNDYRGFPFETVARGPSWFLNGGPDVTKILYTAWNLAPYVPPSALGLRAISPRRNIDTEMAAALASHVTFSFPVDQQLTPQQRAQVRRWTDFYRANRDTIAGFTYPLLADPRAGGWTALQPWDGDAAEGWVLAYRQKDARASVTIPLRGLGRVAADVTFDVTRVDPAKPEVVHPTETLSAAQLRAGLFVDAASEGYAIFRVARTT